MTFPRIKLTKTKGIALIIILFLVLSAFPAYILIKNRKSSVSTTAVAGVTVEKPKFVRLEIFDEGVSVKTRNSQDFKQAIEGQEVLEGSTLKTDATGRAQVVYPNASTTRIDSNSEITLSGYSPAPFNVKIDLDVGRIWSRVAKLLGTESYQTQSPSVVAAVRGTSYGHAVLPNGEDKITVTKGAVLSDCLNKNQTSEVAENQKGLFDYTKTPPKLELIDESDRDEWLDFNSEEDIKIEEMYGEETFADISGVLGTENFSGLYYPKLQYDAKLELYYFAPKVKSFSPSLTNYLLATPTPTPSLYNLDPSLLNLSPTLLNLRGTPTPTPSTSKLNTSPNLLETNLNLNFQTTTPSPTPLTTKNNFGTTIDPNLNLNLNLQNPPTPSPTFNPIYIPNLRGF